jgi:acetyltransferase
VNVDDRARPMRAAVLAALAAVAPEADLAGLRGDRPLRTQIDLDSIDWLNLLGRIEQELGGALPDSGVGSDLSLDALVARLAAPPPATRADAPTPPRTETFVLAGRRITLRPMTAADLALESEFVRGLSPEARYKRFMTTVAELPKSKLAYLTDVDQAKHVALVATTGDDGDVDPVGVVRYVVEPGGESCEFAIALDDAVQHTGLAGIMMRRLIDIARAHGLRTMFGLVLAANGPMLRFTRQLGFRQAHEPDDYATVRVTLDL